jgi:hypothetical protein
MSLLTRSGPRDEMNLLDQEALAQMLEAQVRPLVRAIAELVETTPADICETWAGWFRKEDEAAAETALRALPNWPEIKALREAATPKSATE